MKTHITLAAAMALTAGTAAASLPDFDALDKDRDGMISLNEASVSEAVTSMFAKADIDKDGKLSPAEYDALK